MPATTISPLFGGVLRAAHDEVAVHDADLDHRVAADPQHEQLAGAGEVLGQREQLFDVLLRQHVGAGSDVADERHVAHRAPLDGDARRRVEPHLERTRLGGVAAQVAHPLE